MTLAEFLSSPFLVRGAIAAAVCGFVCAIMGVLVALRGVAFVGEGVSHSALTGVALGIALGVSPTWVALLFCVVIAILVAWVSKEGDLHEDVGTGIFLSASLALGLFVMTSLRARSPEIIGVLFGSILTATDRDLWFSCALAIVVVVTLLVIFKEIVAVVFDPEGAEVLGVPVKFVTYIFFSLIAFTVVATLKLVGIILVTALLLTPAATALQMSRDFHQAVYRAAAIGVVGTEAGYLLSIHLDTPPSATIVLFHTVEFLVVLLAKRVTRG